VTSRRLLKGKTQQRNPHCREQAHAPRFHVFPKRAI
jgi:hypothetical protein